MRKDINLYSPLKTVLLCLVLVGCNGKLEEKAELLNKPIDVARWNQQTVNHIISQFRIDTSYFIGMKQPPPPSKALPYSYPVEAELSNNSIATVWNFVNKRHLVLGVIDSIYQSSNNKLRILELYNIGGHPVYEIYSKEGYYEVTFDSDYNLNIVTRRNTLSTSDFVSGFTDGRKDVSPIRFLSVITIIYPNGEMNITRIVDLLFIDNHSTFQNSRSLS